MTQQKKKTFQTLPSLENMDGSITNWLHFKHWETLAIVAFILILDNSIRQNNSCWTSFWLYSYSSCYDSAMNHTLATVPASKLWQTIVKHTTWSVLLRCQFIHCVQNVCMMSNRLYGVDDGVSGLHYMARLTLASNAIAVTALCQTLSAARSTTRAET